jgi:hypothetical protein
MTAARKVISAVVATVLCGVAMWLWQLYPDLQTKSMDPMRTYGRIGKVITNDTFSIRIDRYDVATSITKPFATTAQVTDGIFLVVHLHAKAEHEPYTMGHARLETRDGLSYDEGGRIGVSADAEETYQPMLWSPGSLLFEIPKNQLAGARVVIGAAPILNQLSAESVIDLGIDGAKAAQLTARPLAGYQLGG